MDPFQPGVGMDMTHLDTGNPVPTTPNPPVTFGIRGIPWVKSQHPLFLHLENDPGCSGYLCPLYLLSLPLSSVNIPSRPPGPGNVASLALRTLVCVTTEVFGLYAVLIS